MRRNRKLRFTDVREWNFFARIVSMIHLFCYRIYTFAHHLMHMDSDWVCSCGFSARIFALIWHQRNISTTYSHLSKCDQWACVRISHANEFADNPIESIRILWKILPFCILKYYFHIEIVFCFYCRLQLRPIWHDFWLFEILRSLDI